MYVSNGDTIISADGFLVAGSVSVFPFQIPQGQSFTANYNPTGSFPAENMWVIFQDNGATAGDILPPLLGYSAANNFDNLDIAAAFANFGSPMIPTNASTQTPYFFGGDLTIYNYTAPTGGARLPPTPLRKQDSLDNTQPSDEKKHPIPPKNKPKFV